MTKPKAITKWLITFHLKWDGIPGSDSGKRTIEIWDQEVAELAWSEFVEYADTGKITAYLRDIQAKEFKTISRTAVLNFERVETYRVSRHNYATDRIAAQREAILSVTKSS
jgi:hypothetical protein